MLSFSVLEYKVEKSHDNGTLQVELLVTDALDENPPLNNDSSDKKQLDEIETDVRKSSSDSSLANCWKFFLKLYPIEHLSSALFITYLLSYAIGTSNYIDHIVFIPLRAKEIGYEDASSMLLALIGVTDLVSRVCCGFVCDNPKIHRGYVVGLSLIVMGTTSCVVTSFPSIYSLVFLCVVWGSVGGVMVSLLAVVLIDFLGAAKFSGAFGLAVMFQAMSNTGWPSFLGTVFFNSNIFMSDYESLLVIFFRLFERQIWRL